MLAMLNPFTSISFHSTAKMEINLLDIFDQYKQMNYFFATSVILNDSGQCWLSEALPLLG